MGNTETPKQKKGLTNALKYFFGVGDAGFVLMSNIETFYFMTFLTDIAGFAAGVAGVINSVFTIVDACLSWLYGGIINGTKAKKWGRYRSWLIMVPWMVPFLYAFMFITYSMAECCNERGEYKEALEYYENALRVLDIYKVKDSWYGFREGFNEGIAEIKEKSK